MRIIHPDEKAYAGALILKAIGGPKAFYNMPATNESFSFIKEKLFSTQLHLVHTGEIEGDLPAARLEWNQTHLLRYGSRAVIRFRESDDKPFDPRTSSAWGAPACCVLIRCPVTQAILAVSRRYDPCAMSLPGGGIIKGESSAEGALRELREETGIVLGSSALLGPPFWYQGCVTYEARQQDIACVVPREHRGGRVAWVSEHELLAGPFGGYNRRLLDVLNERRRAL